MADLSTLARPYAKAAFELARDSGSFQVWGEALGALAAAVKSPELAGLIGHPALFKDDLAEALARGLAPNLGEQGASLVRLLVENHRVPVVPFIAEQFEALRAEAESRAEVEITSAAPIAPEQQQQLVDAVSRRLGRQVHATWNIDESLLAGARIRAGDLVIDGSIKGELEKLKTALAS